MGGCGGEREGGGVEGGRQGGGGGRGGRGLSSQESIENTLFARAARLIAVSIRLISFSSQFD